MLSQLETFTMSSIPVHRKKFIILDSNVLLVLIVGKFNTNLLGKHPRVEEYDLDAYKVLVQQLENYDGILTTPNILTEVSNLLQNDKNIDVKMASHLKTFIDWMEEQLF